LYGINSAGTHEDFGYVLAASNPNMPTSPSGGYNYADQTLYAKLALRDFLSAKYGTIGALNAAWGTRYTTFDTSDRNGDAGIKNGQYTSYGTGTGFLDENGAHILPTGENCNDISVLDTWWPAAFPAIGSDLHNFVAFFASTYGKKLMG